MENNEYIERYLYEVGRRLPGKSREDIIKELRSLIQDELEARVGKGKAPSKEDILAVLKQMGSPAEVAARYSEWPQYLVGPELFPVYKIVLAILVGVSVFAAVLSFIVQAAQTGPQGNIGPAVGTFFGAIFSGALSAVGAVTIIFAIIERVRKAHREKFESAMKDMKDGLEKGFGWNPEKMQPVPRQQDTLRRGEMIAGIVFSTLAIVLFNVFLERIGIYYTDVNGAWSFIPVINDTLRSYVMLWNISWAASIALSIVVLSFGRWNLGTRITDIALSIFGIAVAAIMLAGPSIVPTQAILDSWRGSMSAAELQHILSIVEKVVIGVLIFAVVMGCVGLGQKIYRMARSAKA